MKAPRLGELHASMRAHIERRVSFIWVNGATRFNVVFISDPSPFLAHLPKSEKARQPPIGLLMFAVVGTGETFIKQVYPGYWFEEYMGDDYGRLAQLLRGDHPRGTPLSVKAFFEDFVGKIPTSMSGVRNITWKDLPWRPKVEEEDKIYFISYRTNPVGEHVTEANLAKTAAIIGELERDACREYNMSSCWTDDPDKARSPRLPQRPRIVDSPLGKSPD